MLDPPSSSKMLWWVLNSWTRDGIKMSRSRMMQSNCTCFQVMATLNVECEKTLRSAVGVKKNNMKKVKHKIFWRDNIIILPFKNYLIQQTLKLYEIRWDVKYIMDRCCLQCIVLSTPFFVTFSLVTKLTHLGFFNEILKWKLIPVPSSTVPILNQSNLVHHTLFGVILLLIIPLTGLGCIR